MYSAPSLADLLECYYIVVSMPTQGTYLLVGMYAVAAKPVFILLLPSPPRCFQTARGGASAPKFRISSAVFVTPHPERFHLKILRMGNKFLGSYARTHQAERREAQHAIGIRRKFGQTRTSRSDEMADTLLQTMVCNLHRTLPATSHRSPETHQSRVSQSRPPGQS